MSNFVSLPFKTKTNSGFSQIEGLAKFSAAGIVLEFESKFLGLIPAGVSENRIPLDEILDVTLRKGFFKFGAKIEIRLKSLARVKELPNKDGRVVLEFARRDFDIAVEAVKRIDESRIEHTLDERPASVSFLEDGSEADTAKLGEEI